MSLTSLPWKIVPAAFAISGCLFLSFALPGKEPQASTHILNLRNSKDLKAFFHYTPDRLPFISSHRGGPKKGFPENCLATFNNTLKYTWSLIEMDPHYT